jgi:hypothetical protein
MTIIVIADTDIRNAALEETDEKVKKYCDRLIKTISKGIPARFDRQSSFLSSLKNLRMRLSEFLKNFPLIQENKATVAGIIVIMGRQATIHRNCRITTLVISSNIL